MVRDIQIAWRNLWRNYKRTLITLSAIILAVLLATVTSSMQEGTYARMIDNMVKFYTGYIQIHHPDYWDTKSINDVYKPDDKLLTALNSLQEIQLAVPRLESFTLVSSGEHTKGCSLIGIDPEKEDSLTNLSRWLIRGSFLTSDSAGILVAANIAKNLGAGIGDTLVLLSQGYQGSSASALMPVKGILEFPSEQLNNFAVYINLNSAGEFFSTPGMVTSISLMVPDYHRAKYTAAELQTLLGSQYSVKTWDIMQPDLVKMIEGDKAGAVIMKGILYLVVGFGILGTIIMMMAERRKETGVMVAIGMQKYRLQKILTYESMLMGITGVIAGVIISIPVILYFVSNPIPLTGETGKIYKSFGIEPAFYFGISAKIFLNQAITVLIITLLIAIYPIGTIARMQVIRALHGL